MADYPKCETCRHWKLAYADFFNLCSDGKTSELFGECSLTKLPRSSQDKREMIPKMLAYAQDVENYFAILLTKPDFGCTQHQPRES